MHVPTLLIVISACRSFHMWEVPLAIYGNRTADNCNGIAFTPCGSFGAAHSLPRSQTTKLAIATDIHVILHAIEITSV